MSDFAPKEETQKVLTLEQIMMGLSEMAQHGEGAQRAAAFRLLMGASGANVSLPEPLTDREVVERLARLMRAFGKDTTRKAFSLAFPALKTRPWKAPEVSEGDIDWSTFRFPVSIRHFYQKFPECKRPGRPKGFPIKGGLERKKAWLIEETKRIIMDRRQKEMESAAAQEREEQGGSDDLHRPADESTAPGDGTEGGRRPVAETPPQRLDQEA